MASDTETSDIGLDNEYYFKIENSLVWPLAQEWLF